MTSDPRAIYTDRRDRLAEEAVRAGRRAERLGWARLLAFTALLVVLWVTAGMGWWFLVGLGVGVPLFAVLVRASARADERSRGATAAQRWYTDGLARLDGQPEGDGPTGEAFRDPAHPYAGDLDLFGPRSVFARLCRARTPAGRKALAGWLAEAADVETIAVRQEAVAELRDRLDLREASARIAGEVGGALERAGAGTWFEPPRRSVGGAALVAASVLTGIWILGTAVAAVRGDLGWGPFLMGLFVQVLLSVPQAGRIKEALIEAGSGARDLLLVGRLGACTCEHPFTAVRLQSIHEAWAGFEGRGLGPALQRLGVLEGFRDSLANPFFLPIAWVLGVPRLLAWRLEAWRTTHGPHALRWVEALGEFEALDSLASDAYEHPDHVTPDVVAGEPFVKAVGLGHPLLPATACIRNDVHLAREGTPAAALLISGSNMSGKSTLMRALGVNIVIALAGGNVRATSFRTTPLRIGASIRIHDSLDQGISHFQAEILRIKQIVDLGARGEPTLFLLDEVLHGTNSHDRRAGTDAILHGLLRHGALGLVSTHDLALARIADEHPRMRNVHFRDEMVEGRMRFDYRLHEGVVDRSNALELMRAIGLEVDGPNHLA